MANQTLADYIKTQLQLNQDQNGLIQALRIAGWSELEINEAFAAVNQPVALSPAAQSTSYFPTNSEVVKTEKDYPVTWLWVFKAPLIYLILSIVAFLFGYWFPVLVILFPYWLIVNPLTKANFHYALEKDYFVIHQGILSKKQRNLPYGVIQNVLVKQDIFDRIFGLASIMVENFSQGGSKKIFGMAVHETQHYQDAIGNSGSKVYIPGLHKDNAEAFKIAILEKVKTHPLEDRQSGL